MKPHLAFLEMKHKPFTPDSTERLKKCICSKKFSGLRMTYLKNI